MYISTYIYTCIYIIYVYIYIYEIKKYRETIVYLIRAIDPKRYNQRWPMTPAWE